MATITVCAGLIMALVAVVGAFRHVGKDARQRNHDTLVLLVALIAFGVVLAIIGTQLALEPEQDLRTVLVTGGIGSAFVTAIFAMWLNNRRYRIEQARQRLEDGKAALEQSRHRLDQEKVELEIAKDRREHDKAVSDVLLKTAELYGSAEPLTRAASMHALATLAAQRPDRTQEVVDLLCLYLRCSADGDDEAVREAQKVLSRVVAWAGRCDEAVPRLEIDLAGARLRDLVLDGRPVHGVDLSAARLHGTTSLLRLGTLARCQVNLDDVVSDGNVWLPDARLSRLSASRATVDGNLSMAGARVEHEVNLSDATVTGDLGLDGAELGSLTCGATVVGGTVSLRRTRVTGSARFAHARFEKADLELAVCDHTVVFDSAHFAKLPRLDRARFSQVSLWHTTVGDPIAPLPLPPGWGLVGGPDDVRYLVHTNGTVT